MIDPLIAIGAVASISQLIDLGIKTVAKSREIHKSASGSLVENEDLTAVTQDLFHLSKKLKEQLRPTAHIGPITADEQALYDLCEGCINASKELVEALEKLKARGKPNVFRSFRQGLKCVWSKDEIVSMEMRLRLYKDELNSRIIVTLRTNIDLLAVQQSDGFQCVDAATKSVMTSLDTLNGSLETGFEDQTLKLSQLHGQTKVVMEGYAEQVRDDQEATRAEIARLSLSADERDAKILDTAAVNKAAIESAMDQNVAEHDKTRQAMQRIKDQAESQIEQLTEQIRQLKIDIEASLKDMVARMATVSAREQQNLKEITNAKFNLWAALELMVEKLKTFVAMFKFNFADELWSSATVIRTWKIMPYPKPTPEGPAEDVESDGHARATEQSLAYFHVDLCYPIAAGNVPMVEMCLNHGADVNKRLPLVPYGGMTPLMKAVATAYEFTEFDSIRTILPMRHNARKIVQLLIEHGADPNQVDARGRDAQHVAKNPRVFISSKDRCCISVDWLIEQSLESPPDPDLAVLLALTDAVWGFNIGKVESILSEYPELCNLADDYMVSALGSAAFCGIDEIARLLLTHGASPDGPDATGSSPLAIAVAVDRLAMADLLLHHGARTDLTDPFLGLLPLEYAAREGNDAMCQTMISHLRQRDSTELANMLSKPLCLAVRHYQIDTVRLLLDNGADVRTNMSIYLASWEKEAYRSAHSGRLIDNMTPRTYVENKIRERMLPPDLPSHNLLKLLIEMERRTGIQTLNPGLSEPIDHLTDLSSKYRRVSKRRSFMVFNKSTSDLTESDTSTMENNAHLDISPLSVTS